VRQGCGVRVEGGEHRVGRPVDVRRVRRQGRFAARHGHRLDLVEHDHGRQAVVSQGRDVLAEQLAHLALALPVLGAHQPVRVHLDEARAAAGGQRRELLGQSAGQGRLAGARRPVQQLEAVQRRHLEAQARAQLEAEQGRPQ
jgi:hypothetical protein